MIYAIQIDSKNRINRWEFTKYVPADQLDQYILVDTIPEGNLPDYLYINGEYVYAPLPRPSNIPAAPRNIIAGEYITIDGVLYKAIFNIPNGERIIVGQNAIETTIEQQLYELTMKGE